MTNFIKCAFLVGVIFLFTGCAQRYTYIEPEKQFYKPMPINDGVEFSYKFDMLNEKGNTKFHANALRKEIKVVTVRIKNCTDSTINIARDLQFYSGNTPITLLDPILVRNQIKQQWYWYLGYMSIYPTAFYVIVNGTVLVNWAFGAILGPGLTILNIHNVYVANKNLLIDLTDNDIRDSEISNRQTIYGIICYYEQNEGQLSVKFKNQSQKIDLSTSELIN